MIEVSALCPPRLTPRTSWIRQMFDCISGERFPRLCGPTRRRFRPGLSRSNSPRLHGRDGLSPLVSRHRCDQPSHAILLYPLDEQITFMFLVAVGLALEGIDGELTTTSMVTGPQALLSFQVIV
jgi:hypothetical protein